MIEKIIKFINDRQKKNHGKFSKPEYFRDFLFEDMRTIFGSKRENEFVKLFVDELERRGIGKEEIIINEDKDKLVADILKKGFEINNIPEVAPVIEAEPVHEEEAEPVDRDEEEPQLEPIKISKYKKPKHYHQNDPKF